MGAVRSLREAFACEEVHPPFEPDHQRTIMSDRKNR
jgi:hypothetical protein